MTNRHPLTKAATHSALPSPNVTGKELATLSLTELAAMLSRVSHEVYIPDNWAFEPEAVMERILAEFQRRDAIWAEAPKVTVHIIESEAGWGQKVDEVKQFDTRQQAETFCRDYNNKYNNAPTTPGWYMVARIVD